MHEIFSELVEPRGTEAPRPSVSGQEVGGSFRIQSDEDSFPDLLADCERQPILADRSDLIARYLAWIGRNSSASTALHGAWFNLGVELTAAGDKPGAIEAYRNALALRPGFYPAAINLGTIMEFSGHPEDALAIWRQALQVDRARASLLEHRNRLIEGGRLAWQKTAKVLHLGCANHKTLPMIFRGAGWSEVRVEIDPPLRPDLMTRIKDPEGADGLFDAVYSPQAITYLHRHDVALTLQDMHKVLKPTGFTLITLLDLQELALHIGEGKLEQRLYMSPTGPVSSLELLYGSSVASGSPRTGFTSVTLAAALISAGFAAVLVQRDPSAFSLTAIGFRSTPNDEQLVMAQAQMLPAANRAAVLFTQPAQ